MADNQQTQSDVVDLKVNLAKIEVIVEKLDKTTEQLTEISKSVSNILTVHEQKLSLGDKYFEEIRRQLIELLQSNADVISSINQSVDLKMKEFKETQVIPLETRLNNYIEQEHKPLQKAVSRIQKIVWIGTGVLAVLGLIWEFLLR